MARTYEGAYSVKNPGEYMEFLKEGEAAHKAALKKTNISEKEKKRHKKALQNIENKMKQVDK